MSLLLDALKKAAEQKAEKSKQEATPKPTGDETVIEAAPDDPSVLESDAEESQRLQRRVLDDETQIDHSELATRYENTRVERDNADDTGIDAPDQTDTRIAPGEQQMGGEDETLVFAEDDVSEFMGDPRYVNREPLQPDDETDLSQVPSAEDQTGSGRDAQPARNDETDLSQLLHREDETDFRQSGATDDDETDISRPSALADQIETGQAGARARDDETDLSRVGDADGEGPDPSLLQEPEDDETDLSRYDAGAEADSEPEPPQVVASDDDEPSAPPEDMSLLLSEQDMTGLTSRTSPTDPRMAGGLPETGDADLELVDTTRHRMPPEQTSTTEATTRSTTGSGTTATTGARLDTLTTEGTTTRAESTATRTYAPDNYDRTLMKLPSDDASRLFAGMKSDSDVVMTPDYAKKVFRSKSTAQRLQHIRVYVGIFAVLLISVLIYGFFEYSSHSDSIDASLRPLKRDPMPGVIQPQETRNTQLFAETGEVSAQTLEIIESAEDMPDAEVADQGVIAGDGETTAPAGDDVDLNSAETAATGAEGSVSATSADGTSLAGGTSTVTGSTVAAGSAARDESSGGVSAVAASSAADSGVIASLDTQTPAPAQTANSNSSLQISSSSRLDEKLLKLREAYAAYQAGNDARALELYNEVLAMEPGNRNALLGRAAIYVQNGNPVGAVDDYQTLLLTNPKDSLAMSSLIAVVNMSPQESESRLKLMLRDEPESPYLNFALANAYSAQKRWREAQGHYFTALQNRPEDPNYAYNLAVSLEHIAQPRAALTYYRRALENLGNGLATFNKDVVEQRVEVLGRL